MVVFYEELGEKLSLYVRQVAWLNAVPRTKSATGPDVSHPARIAAYKASGAEPPLPLLYGRFVFDWLRELGFNEPVGMGVGPVSWREIDAWKRGTETKPSPAIARLLRRLSAEFVTESREAEDIAKLAPFSPEPTQVDRDVAERQLRSILG